MTQSSHGQFEVQETGEDKREEIKEAGQRHLAEVNSTYPKVGGGTKLVLLLLGWLLLLLLLLLWILGFEGPEALSGSDKSEFFFASAYRLLLSAPLEFE